MLLHNPSTGRAGGSCQVTGGTGGKEEREAVKDGERGYCDKDNYKYKKARDEDKREAEMLSGEDFVGVQGGVKRCTGKYIIHAFGTKHW